MSNQRQITGPYHTCRGFSMVELMVALVITLILLAGVSQIFLGSKKSFVIQDALGRMQENGRYAMEVITQDIRRAGYYGGNADLDNIDGSLGVATNTDTCPKTDTTWGRMLNRRVFGINNDAVIATDYACIPKGSVTFGYQRGDVLVTRYAAPWVIGGVTTPAGYMTDAATKNRLFLRASLFQGRLFQGLDEAKTENNLASSSVRTSELIAHGYYVGDSGQTCRGEVVPSLLRVSLGSDGTPAIEEVAYGVDQFQVRYGKDTDGDDSVDEFVDAGTANLDESGEWDQVIAARIWLLIRAECPETGYSNTNSYEMADLTGTDAYTSADSFRRKLYLSTVKLRNRNI
jgi:type IV pilus assembly protein PilW